MALTHKYFVLARVGAWLLFMEFSIPFLHMRWFYAVSNLKESKAYFMWSTLFMISFVVVRWIGYGYGIVDIWRNVEEWKHAPIGARFVITAVHLGFVLNLGWGTMVVKSFAKNLKIQMYV